MSNHAQQGTMRDTVSGTILTVYANIGSHDYIRTMVLAAVGATVSFAISTFLKWIVSRYKKEE